MKAGTAASQPWPELGDATLQEELDALRKGSPLPLGIRALECARTDGEARAKGASLFDGLHIPASHATLPSCVSPATIRIMESKGFKAGKIKASPNLAAALERLTMLASMVPAWRWRLDFNGCLNENDALKFWKSLPHHLKTRIDFIEDPCPFSVQSWERLVDAGMPLALDMGSDSEHQPGHLLGSAHHPHCQARAGSHAGVSLRAPRVHHRHGPSRGAALGRLPGGGLLPQRPAHGNSPLRPLHAPPV